MNRESFSCSDCLSDISPKEVKEDNDIDKMLELSNTIGQLATMESPPSSVESSDLELEELSEQISNDSAKTSAPEYSATDSQTNETSSVEEENMKVTVENEAKEAEENRTNKKDVSEEETVDLTKEDQTPSPRGCCIWNSCEECDKKKNEISHSPEGVLTYP